MKPRGKWDSQNREREHTVGEKKRGIGRKRDHGGNVKKLTE